MCTRVGVRVGVRARALCGMRTSVCACVYAHVCTHFLDGLLEDSSFLFCEFNLMHHRLACVCVCVGGWVRLQREVEQFPADHQMFLDYKSTLCQPITKICETFHEHVVAI